MLAETFMKDCVQAVNDLQAHRLLLSLAGELADEVGGERGQQIKILIRAFDDEAEAILGYLMYGLEKVHPDVYSIEAEKYKRHPRILTKAIDDVQAMVDSLKAERMVADRERMVDHLRTQLCQTNCIQN